MKTSRSYGGHSMVARLRRVVVCSPATAGWKDPDRSARWRELNYHHHPESGAAEGEHRRLVETLERSGSEVIGLPEAEGLSMDAVYPHDASLVTDHGAILLRMGKKAREKEPDHHGRLYQSLGIPILGRIEPPGTAEGGDMVWLDEATLLVGEGYRTNDTGFQQMREILRPKGIEVLSAPLPHGPGPGGCLHLMSLISLLDERVVLVDLPWLSVSTVQLLSRRGFDWIEIDDAESSTLACNVLALGERRLLALEENARTNARLREKGFHVDTFPGSEIAQNGGGGPTCLTRPVLRSP